MKNLATIFISIFLVASVSQAARRSDKGWAVVSCEDGFSFEVHKAFPSEKYSTIDKVKVDNTVLLASDEGADSDVTFGHGNEAVYMSRAILMGSTGRVFYDGENHKNCAYAVAPKNKGESEVDIKELRCRFLGECD